MLINFIESFLIDVEFNPDKEECVKMTRKMSKKEEKGFFKMGKNILMYQILR